MRTEVEKVLRMADVIIYLLDYTKLNSNDEHLLFGTISQLRRDLVSEIKDRLFFVVNKYDSKNENSLTIEQTSEFISNSLQNSIGLKMSKIHCVSAEKALLARMIRNGNYDRINDLGRKSFGDEGWDDSNSVDEKVKMFDGRLDAIITKTSMPELENDIIDYIVNNSESLFYKSIIDKTLKIIQETENRFSAKLALMQKDASELKRILNEIKNKVEKIRSDLNKINSIVNSFSKEIESEVNKRFNDFEKTISELIQKVVKYKKSDSGGHSKLIEDFIDTGSELAMDSFATGKNEKEKSQNKKVLRQIYKLGKTGLKLIINIVGEWNKKVDPDEARKNIEKINQSIYELLKIGFTTVKEELEIKISTHSNKVNDELQRIINIANNELFDAINRELKMNDQFTAVHIELPKEDSFKLSADYDDFLSKTKKDRAGGFCKPKECVVDTVELKADLLAQWWTNQLCKEKKTSLTAVNRYIKEAVVKKIEDVKKGFNSNAETYLNMIISEQAAAQKEQSEKEDCERAIDESILKLKAISDGIAETNFV